jgi:hypothetical protein
MYHSGAALALGLGEKNPTFQTPMIEASNPFTDSDLDRMEETLGRKLPEDYRSFVKEYGGPFVGGEVEGSDDTTILTFYQGAKYRGESSLFRTYDDLTEIGALPFARCVFGNFYVLTARNEVWNIDFTGGETSSMKVTTSFNDFLSRIVVDRGDQ